MPYTAPHQIFLNYQLLMGCENLSNINNTNNSSSIGNTNNTNNNEKFYWPIEFSVS
jgi:hypothetical protein